MASSEVANIFEFITSTIKRVRQTDKKPNEDADERVAYLEANVDQGEH